ncbi:MAG: hypothetical protein VKJ06_07090 [Vampirovibrionales bacterium]|nr:hypothetical protein [Vampirovibrionales bacterium]
MITTRFTTPRTLEIPVFGAKGKPSSFDRLQAARTIKDSEDAAHKLLEVVNSDSKYAPLFQRAQFFLQQSIEQSGKKMNYAKDEADRARLQNLIAVRKAAQKILNNEGPKTYS